MYKLKILFCCLIGLLSEIPVSAQSVVINDRQVECFELLSTIFRLSGAREYTRGAISSYNQDVDSYFSSYKNHPAVVCAQEARKQYGISYDAIGIAAAHMCIEEDRIKAAKGVDIEHISKIDSRWSQEYFLHFLSLVDRFFVESKFHLFWEKHSFLYKAAKSSFVDMGKAVNLPWLEDLFGLETNLQVHAIPSISCGPNNYGFSYMQDGKLQTGVILGCGFDEEAPLYMPAMLTILTHEIIHTHSNALGKQYWTQLDPYITQILSLAEISKVYSTPQSLLNEWLAILFELCYMKENAIPGLPVQVDQFITMYQDSGFIWLRRSLLFMDYFFNQRQSFLAVDDFMPYLAQFLKKVVEDWERISIEYKQSKPYIIASFPLRETVISDANDSIFIRFSEPMRESFAVIDEVSENKASIINGKSYWKTSTLLVIPIRISNAYQRKECILRLDKRAFISQKGRMMAEDVMLRYNVKYRNDESF